VSGLGGYWVKYGSCISTQAAKDRATVFVMNHDRKPVKTTQDSQKITSFFTQNTKNSD
jgi:hypothetical protein